RRTASGFSERFRPEERMKIDFVGRHLHVEEATRTLAAEKLGKIVRYLHEPVEAHIVLEAGKHRHMAEVQLRGGRKEFVAKEEAITLHDALELAVEKVEEQAKRAHEKDVQAKRR
ncbi:MAG: ribosome-associated translation inhibitor RaiA, partial [Thermoanaerobaculia bacterium]